MTDNNGMDGEADLLKRAHQSPGFHLGVHEIIHGADPEYVAD